MKSKNSLNAQTHGLYVYEFTLPWEDTKAYAAYCDAIRDELMPDGPLEEATTYEIANMQWRKRRLTLHWQLQCHKQGPSPELMAAAKDGPEKFVAYFRDLEKSEPSNPIMTTEEMAKLLRNKRATGPASEHAADKTTENYPGQTAAPTQNARSDREIIQRAYDPSSIEQQLKLEAMIEARITKALGRLANLKEYKRIYGQKSLPAAPPASPPLALTAPINEITETEPAVHVTPKAAEANTKKIRQWGDPD